MMKIEIDSEDESPWQVVKSNKTTKINSEAAQLNFLKDRNIKLIVKTIVNALTEQQNNKKSSNFKISNSFLNNGFIFI